MNAEDLKKLIDAVLESEKKTATPINEAIFEENLTLLRSYLSLPPSAHRTFVLERAAQKYTDLVYAELKI